MSWSSAWGALRLPPLFSHALVWGYGFFAVFVVSLLVTCAAGCTVLLSCFGFLVSFFCLLSPLSVLSAGIVLACGSPDLWTCISFFTFVCSRPAMREKYFGVGRMLIAFDPRIELP